MGPALTSRRRHPLRRDGKAARNRTIAPVETGLAPSPQRGTAETRKAASLPDTSVTFGLLPPDFCTLHAAARIRQDSGYPDISLLPGLTAHVQFRYWRKEWG